jgi:hypothetical protein
MLRIALLLVLATALTACSTGKGPLTVKTFVLRDQERDAGIDPWARMEKESRLRGAISMEERRQRLGQYYTVLWNDPSIEKSAPVTITFEYQQGATGSRIKHMTQKFGGVSSEGRASFAVIGDDYIKNGRVLAWQVTLRRGDREVASRRSYLWQ